MTTRDAGLTQEQVEAAEVHAAGSSHCGEIKSKSAFSRDSTVLYLCIYICLCLCHIPYIPQLFSSSSFVV
jgi:hypothetical protein